MNGKVLVIEDDPFWQSLLKGYLEEADYKVVIESEIQNALAMISNEIFHFITLDLQLSIDNNDASEYEGWKILAEVKRHQMNTSTGIMVITGFDVDYNKLRKIKQSGSTYFMPKNSFQRKQFIEILNNCVKLFNKRFYKDQRDNNTA